MNKFWCGAGLAAFMLSGIWMLGIEFQLNIGTPGLRWVFDDYQYKINAANKVTGPRVLVVAGSNALFGIDSEKLEAYWNRSVVNLGVNAGLGLPYILDVSKRIARPGDVVLMPMEYAMYLDDGSPNAQIIDYVIARDSDYWRRLSFFQRMKFSLGMTPERWLQGLQRLPDIAVTEGVYGAHHLNARGDQTNSAPADQTAAEKTAVNASKSWDYGAQAKNKNGGWTLIKDYANWSQRNKVCIIAVPTALMHHEKYDQDKIEIEFYENLPSRISSLGISYMGRPRDFMYPAFWFFNTDHHLMDWARVAHTEKIIKLLNRNPLNHCLKSDSP